MQVGGCLHHETARRRAADTKAELVAREPGRLRAAGGHHHQSRRRADHHSEPVADGHCVKARLRRLHVRDEQRGVGSGGDGDAVLAPLVSEWVLRRGHDREGYRAAPGDVRAA